MYHTYHDGESPIASRDDQMATQAGRRAELQKLSSGGDEWTVYRTLCQFRLGYFSFLVLMCILMFSVTFLMEIFFAIFLPSARMNPYFTIRSILLLSFLPFAVIFLSYCFEESSRLFLDAIDSREGSLANFRLSLCVCIHYLRHWRDMPDDRLERERFDAFKRHDEDHEAWTRFVSWITAGPRYLLSTIYTNDPFDDTNKESEDEKRYELELLFQRQQSDELSHEQSSRCFSCHRNISHSSSSSSSGQSSPSIRWKRAFQAASTTVKFNTTHFDGPPLDFSTLVMTDVLCPFVFELITMWMFTVSLVTNMSPLAAFLDYIECGFYMQAVYLGLWMICHFCSARNRKMREFVSNYRRRYRDMQRRLLEMENEKRAEHLWLVSIGFRAVEQFQTSFFTLVEALFEFGAYIRVSCSLWTFVAEGEATAANAEHQPLQHDDMLQHTRYTQVIPETDMLVEGTCDPVKDANETEEALEGKQRLHKISECLRDLNLWSKFSYERRLRILCPIVILSAIISFYAFYVGWGIMGVCLILLGDTIQAKFPQVFGLTFKSFITFFVTLSFVFFSSTWAIGTFVHGGDFFVFPPTSESRSAPATSFAMKKSTTSPMHWAKVAQYPVCALDMETLDIVDFALIADSIYGWNTAVQMKSFAQRFNGTELGDWEYISRNNEAAGHQVWAELYFPTINMTVIAVRGTATATDALEDLHYWFGVSIMQAANIFIPFLKQLPSQFVVEMLSMKFLRAFMPPPVYSELLDHVNIVRQRVGNRLVLTGHSLGGAMAAMVGAKTHTSAVSFSGPGLLYSRGRFDVNDESIRDYVVTVKPRRDIVPQIDELGGMVQEIECRRDNPLACHSIVTHMCELYSACGDKRKRDWSKATQCTAYFLHT